MIVERSKTRVKCDASGCNNSCDYTIVNKKFVFDGNVYLCEDCMRLLYTELAKFIVPKNIRPVFKKGDKDEQGK